MASDQTFQQCLISFVEHDYEASVGRAYDLLHEGAGHEILQVLLIALARLDRDEELGRIGSQALEVTRSHPWYSALVQLTLGQVEPSEVAGAASDDTQRCQARFYTAMRLETLGEANQAENELDACLALESQCLERQLAEAIRRRGKSSNGRAPVSDEDATKVFAECVDLFIRSEYEACLAKARTLIPSAALRSDLAQLMLICLERLGRKDQHAAFAEQVLSATEGHPWFHGLMRLTLGQAELSEVLEMAQSDFQRCQAHYYAGERLLTEGKPKEARSHFDVCLREKVDCPEYTLASIEKLYPLEGPPVQGQQRTRGEREEC